MPSDKKIKTLKVDNSKTYITMFLLNKDNLIIPFEESIILIDVKNRIIKNKFKYNFRFSKLIYINEKVFLYHDNGWLFQYEFEDSNTIKLKGEKKINIDLISKYPEDKLIIYKEKKFSIYG